MPRPRDAIAGSRRSEPYKCCAGNGTFSTGQPLVAAPGSGYVTSGSTQAGTRIMTDSQGRQIVVDSAYADAPGQRSRSAMPDPTIDRTTGVITAPGYMGPRDASGQ